MSARRQKPQGATVAAAAAAVSRDEIERRAYEIFRGRGGAAGDATADWLQAERELIEQARHASARPAAALSPRKQAPARPSPRSG